MIQPNHNHCYVSEKQNWIAADDHNPAIFVLKAYLGPFSTAQIEFTGNGNIKLLLNLILVCKLLETEDLKAILVAEHLMNNQLLEKTAERQRPLIIPIPELQGPKMLQMDLIAELIKHKTGIEVKL